MEREELQKRIDAIIAMGDDDPEASHSDEDKLAQDVIAALCPPWVVEEMGRLWRSGQTRWYA